MSFYAPNAFAGGPYILAEKDAALVGGAPATLAQALDALAQALDNCDALFIGAGAGLSAAAGHTYSGERFERYFSDFRDRFGITDMYSGGFYPFPDLETYWGWWSRHIMINRYNESAGQPYHDLLELAHAVQAHGGDYFVLTTNVDHQFQLAGFDKARLFYTQGDYGQLQCQRNCRGELYENEQLVRAMIARQHDLRVPSELIPFCPHCGAPLVPRLRADASFCEDAGWNAALARYQEFCGAHADKNAVFLEGGVGANTPVIIKYPFWQAVHENERATYACINLGEAYAPEALARRSMLLDGDLGKVLHEVTKSLQSHKRL